MVWAMPLILIACSPDHLLARYSKRGSGSAPMALSWTRCATPASTAARATLAAPWRLTASKVCPRLSTMTATRLTTASQPANAAASPDPLTTSAGTRVAAGSGAPLARAPREIRTSS